jgi:hypothetical protein
MGRIFQAETRYLEILRDNWGAWSVRDNKIVFESTATRDAFNKVLSDLREATAAAKDWIKNGGGVTPNQPPSDPPQNK